MHVFPEASPFNFEPSSPREIEKYQHLFEHDKDFNDLSLEIFGSMNSETPIEI
jgi:hypothetical protein